MRYRIDLEYYTKNGTYSHTETIENLDVLPLPNISSWEWEWDEDYSYIVKCMDSVTNTLIWARMIG